jgi:TatA/E family protein of Tat protein translocase
VGNIGAPEIIVVLVLALLIFGPNRLPQLGRQIGRAMREFRQATADIQKDFDLALNEDDEPGRPAAAGAPAVIDVKPAADASAADGSAAAHAAAQPDRPGFAETLPAAVAAGSVEDSDGESAIAPAEAAAPAAPAEAAGETPPAADGGS